MRRFVFLIMLIFVLPSSSKVLEPTFEPLVQAPENGELIAKSFVLDNIALEGVDITLGESVPLMGYGYGSIIVGFAFLADLSKEEVLTSWDDFHILRDLKKQLELAHSKEYREYLDLIFNLEKMEDMTKEESLNASRADILRQPEFEVSFEDYFRGNETLSFHQVVTDKLSRIRLYIVVFTNDGPILAYALKLPRTLLISTIEEESEYTYLGYTLSYSRPLEFFKTYPIQQYYQLYMTYEKQGKIIYNTYEGALNKPFYSPDIPVLTPDLGILLGGDFLAPDFDVLLGKIERGFYAPPI